MFEVLGTKILAGVVSLSMLLFSSFKGNDPLISSISTAKTGSYLYLKANLENAFENDFPSIFASGSKIPVHYDLVVHQGSRTVASHRITNTVKFDPTTGIYELKQGNKSPVFTESPEEVKRTLAAFEYSLAYQSAWNKINVKLEAHLPKVHFQQLNKELDLMVLWKYKKPSVKTLIDIRKVF